MQDGSPAGPWPRSERRLDLAARAAWLYYIAGNTQEEIAGKLGVSRQAAQRLVSLAVAEKLIKFRLDHRLARGLELARALTDRFALDVCEIAPADPAGGDPTPGIAVAAAAHLERLLAAPEPLVLAFSTGRTLRAMVEQVAPGAYPGHKIVSLVGAMSRDGRASSYEVVLRLADRIGAQCFPVPTPVVASSEAERTLLQTQRSYQAVRALATRAAATFVGIGEIGHDAPLRRDGFLDDAELADLIDRGAVGEIAGWAFTSTGHLIEGGSNQRVAGIPPRCPALPSTIAVGGGGRKVAAIRAALRGRLISGLITDELTAARLMDSSGRGGPA